MEWKLVFNAQSAMVVILQSADWLQKALLLVTYEITIPEGLKLIRCVALHSKTPPTPTPPPFMVYLQENIRPILC